MFKGSCLCGDVEFEVRKVHGPVEICHCNRCRKVSGTDSLTMVRFLKDDYTLLKGENRIESYAAPILYREPAYRTSFCSQCGSPVPPKEIPGDFFEIPAGLFDEDPGIHPDKHIMIEFVPSWHRITDELPQYSIRDMARERRNEELPADFKLRSHYDSRNRNP